jgi:hypothetical protein
MPSQLVALIIVVPCPTDVALPVLSIVATDWFEDAQVTWLEMSWFAVVPAASVKLPVAVNTWLSPLAILGFAGATVMEFNWSTSSGDVVAEMLASVAPMFVTPRATPVARPVLSTVATEVLEELQVTAVL